MGDIEILEKTIELVKNLKWVLGNSGGNFRTGFSRYYFELTDYLNDSDEDVYGLYVRNLDKEPVAYWQGTHDTPEGKLILGLLRYINSVEDRPEVLYQEYVDFLVQEGKKHMKNTTELEKWITRRQAVWTRKLNKARASIPGEGIYDHVDLYATEITALRVLEELNNIKVVINGGKTTDE